MIVDCMTCPVRDQRCDDCVVAVLRAPGWPQNLGMTEPALSEEPQSASGYVLDAAENRAVSVFVGAGLVSATEVARLRARRDALSGWETVRHAG